MHLNFDLRQVPLLVFASCIVIFFIGEGTVSRHFLTQRLDWQLQSIASRGVRKTLHCPFPGILAALLPQGERNQ